MWVKWGRWQTTTGIWPRGPSYNYAGILSYLACPWSQFESRVHPCAKVMALFFKCENFQTLTFFKFLEKLGLSKRSVGKHLCKIPLKSTIALSTHWSLNPETSWFFDFKLQPTMFVTRQNMQEYWYCPKMPSTTIRQRWSVIALIAPNRTGMRAPAFFKRIGIPRRAVNGVLRRHAIRPNEVTDLPRSDRPRKGMCQQWLQIGLSWHYSTEISWSHPRAS